MLGQPDFDLKIFKFWPKNFLNFDLIFYLKILPYFLTRKFKKKR